MTIQVTNPTGNQPQPIKKRLPPKRVKGVNLSMEKFLGKLGSLDSGIQKHEKDAIHPDIKAADIQALQNTMSQAYQAEQVATAQYNASGQAMSQACKSCKQSLNSAAARLRSLYGADSPELADFGVKAHKPRTHKKAKKNPAPVAPAQAQTPVLHQPAPAKAPRRTVKGGGSGSREAEYARVANDLYQMEQGIEKHSKDPNFPSDLTVDWVKSIWNPLINAHIAWMENQRARSAARAQFSNTEKSARKQYTLWVHIVRTSYPLNDSVLLDYGISPRKPRKRKAPKAGPIGPVQPAGTGGATPPAQPQGGNLATMVQSQNQNPVTEASQSQGNSPGAKSTG